jgi:hypothetical protein
LQQGYTGAVRALLLTVTLMFAMPASLAFAAPTCLDSTGITIRCGTPGAMPVGWQPSPQVLWERELSRPPGPATGDILNALCVVVLLFSLIALMPAFDGSQDSDWQSPDGEDRG